MGNKTKENNLTITHPHIAIEWDYKKNGELLPEHFTYGSRKAVWWKCGCGNEFFSEIKYRTLKNKGCNICKKRPKYKENNLSITHPEIAKEWHPTKNGELKPEHVSHGLGKKVWWQCEKGHEWESRIDSRVRYKSSCCVICSQTKLSIGENDLATTHPELAKEWHPTKNNIAVNEIMSNNGKINAWWQCSNCGYEWQDTPRSRKNGSVCKFCNKRGRKEVIVGANDLPTFTPHLIDEWHPTKNGDLTPQDVSYGSTKKVWWMCDKGHEWEAIVSRRTGSSGEPTGCPYCSGRKPIVGETDLATTHPHLAKEWHPTKNNGFTPQQARKGSDKKVWWQCEKGHEWKVAISDRSKGTECPYCSRKIPIVGENDLATTHPELAKEWHPTKNVDLFPFNVLSGSNKKVWWQCKNGHEYDAIISNRTSNGGGCPICNESKGEKAVANYLKSIGQQYIRQYTISDCKNVKPLPFDFIVYIEDKFGFIEYDGEFHYLPIEFAGGEEGLEVRQKRDFIKTQYCLNNNIPLLRIPYWEFDNIATIVQEWLDSLKKTS